MNKWITFVKQSKNLCLDNVTQDEIRQLSNEITDSERKYYKDFDAENILKKSVYIKGVRVNDKLAGISGITLTHGMYSTFHMIKQEYQGKGLGKILAINNIEYSRQHRIPLLIFIIDEDNIASIKNGVTSGDKEIFRYRRKRYSYVALNTKGKIIGWMLPVMKLYFMLKKTA